MNLSFLLLTYLGKFCFIFLYKKIEILIYYYIPPDKSGGNSDKSGGNSDKSGGNSDKSGGNSDKSGGNSKYISKKKIFSYKFFNNLFF